MIDITAGHLFLGANGDGDEDTLPPPPAEDELPFSERPTIPVPPGYEPEHVDTDPTKLFTQQEIDMIEAYRTLCVRSVA